MVKQYPIAIMNHAYLVWCCSLSTTATSYIGTRCSSFNRTTNTVVRCLRSAINTASTLQLLVIILQTTTAASLSCYTTLQNLTGSSVFCLWNVQPSSHAAGSHADSFNIQRLVQDVTHCIVHVAVTFLVYNIFIVHKGRLLSRIWGAGSFRAGRGVLATHCR